MFCKLQSNNFGVILDIELVVENISCVKIVEMKLPEK